MSWGAKLFDVEAMMPAAAPKRDDVRTGTIVERIFEAEALSRGYEVAANTGGARDFDYIVRKPGHRPVVVQVKAAYWNAHCRGYGIRNVSQRGKLYAAHAYDVLASYLKEKGQWLFYARSEWGDRKRTTYRPPEMRRRPRHTKCGKRGKVMPDRNPDNWELLDKVAQSFTQPQQTP